MLLTVTFRRKLTTLVPDGQRRYEINEFGKVDGENILPYWLALQL